MALRLRRGLNADRLNMIPEEGEIIYVTDYDVADVSPLWVGDGSTTGGVAAGATTLDELQDVQIAGIGGVNLADGQTLVYDGTIWRNSREFSVNDSVRAIKHTIEATSADTATQSRTALVVSKKITDISTTAIGDNGGPALTFAAETANAASATTFAQVAALYNDTSGKHDVTILTSDDNFTNNSQIYLASVDRTNINNGVLYVDKLTGRVGVNDITPEFSLDVLGTVRATGAARFDSTVYAASDLTVNNGVILTNSATPEIMLSATGITVGATTGTLTLRNPTVVGSQPTQNVFNTVASTVNAFGFANNINMGANGSLTALAGNLQVNGNNVRSSTGATAVTLNGNAVQVAGILTVNGNQIKSSSANTALTLNGTDVAVAGILTVAGDQIKSSTDATAITLSGQNVAIAGNLTVNGTTTTINSTTLTVDDKNIELANGNTTDAGAAGGGITIKGATDKTLTYVNESGYNHFATNIGFRVDGRIETTTANGLLISPAGAGTSFAPGASYGLRLAGTSGVLLVGNDVSIYGDTLTLNAGQTTGQNAVIAVERGAVDASLQWNESANTWIISNNMVTDGYIGTNGYEFQFNNDDATIGANEMVNLNVKRGASLADVKIRWNQNAGRWQSTTDGTTYISLPNQALDTTSGPTFGGLNITGDATLGDTSGDALAVNATTTFNNNVTIGSSTADTLTVTSQVAPSTNITFANNGTTTVYGTKGIAGTNDYWQFGGGSTATNAGYAEIATGDDGTEPIYARQYTSGSVTNEIQLLDSAGVTQLGDVNAGLVSAARLGLKSGTTTLAIKDAITVTTVSTLNNNLISFDETLYRSAKVTVQIVSGSNYNLVDIMYIHNGTDAYITIGNEIIVGTSLATFTALPGAIQFTSTSATSTRYVADYTLISV